jgi:hypothetical protein
VSVGEKIFLDDRNRSKFLGHLAEGGVLATEAHGARIKVIHTPARGFP